MIYTVTLNPAVDKEYRVADLSVNTVLRASAVNRDLGGKGFNVARMLSALGERCIASGFVGGNAGAYLEQGLEQMGIETDFVHISRETRTNISIVSQSDRNYIKVNEAGPTIPAEKFSQLLDKVRDTVQKGDWWVLAGSLPPGLQVDAYALLIEIINAEGARAVLDTSGEALKYGCKAKPCLIKPNLEELGYLFNKEIRNIKEAEEPLSELHGMGVENILLSAGGGQAIFSTLSRKWRITPPAVKVENPTGAGDAMLAAVVWRLSKNDSIENAFAWGVAAGSSAAGMPGTMMPESARVEKFLNDIVVIEIRSNY